MYQVIQVENTDLIRDEALGTKTKYWFDYQGQSWLYKEARENTGEDWAEKIAYEFAKLLKINAATVELAEYQGKRGSASLSFVSDKKGDVLIHGNEILAGQVLGYDLKKKRLQSQHTLDNIQTAVSKLFKNKDLENHILLALASYLVLDALIGNTDRHHENWGLLLVPSYNKAQERNGFALKVAPTFDHASSLGRELTDEKRTLYMEQKLMPMYINRGIGAVYFAESDKKGANPLRLVEIASNKMNDFFLPTLRILKSITMEQLTEIIDQIPNNRISDTSRKFTKDFVAYNYTALCKLAK